MLELSQLPKEVQEEILSEISSEKTCPIEIDNEIYYIPIQVNNLIDALYKQSSGLILKDDGIPSNKE